MWQGMTSNFMCKMAKSEILCEEKFSHITDGQFSAQHKHGMPRIFRKARKKTIEFT